ncbi:hypothetical protein EUZ85_28715 [Hahella sp. KA22]|uniref:hypothetical protein n=1 Tax=Hahella sp. KA22 TaxID=1628392 RepID=UPI000FDDBE12|nr:hypothetical protein [Hahella sp. KA22]AZZ94480.1 hypothetical protein ENC22_26130 [Hahella sp. KA22]QAY57853.1 hypothetical protein EUZ85_28715 [Hahella sp. KA22]
MDSREVYSRLLESEETLAQCMACHQFDDLLSILKRYAGAGEQGETDPLSALIACNNEEVEPELPLLLRQWTPVRYVAARKRVIWGVAPTARDWAPFWDERIATQRARSIIGSIIKPATRIEYLIRHSHLFNEVRPAGFIFHLSRCGSTLASNLLAVSSAHCVISESGVLTELLLDKDLTENQKAEALRFLLAAQGLAGDGDQDLIVKWNAWDICFWPLLHRLYPDTPSVFIIRRPEEVLASHQRLAGRHMATTDLSVLSHLVAKVDDAAADVLLSYQIEVLGVLMNSMAQSLDSSVLVVDYTELPGAVENRIADHFGVSFSADDLQHLKSRAGQYSKDPSRSFQEDSEDKRRVFSAQDTSMISQKLDGLYSRLLQARHTR